MNPLRRTLQILLPLLVIAGSVVLAKQLAAKAPKPAVADPVRPAPLVRAATVGAIDARLDVKTQGTVEPLRTVDLTSEVSGRIVSTSDALRAGGMFAAGDLLASLDPTDIEFAVVQQRAAVARAELRLMQEQAEGEAAVRAWRKLEGERPADPLVTRLPQQREAEAALAAAKALLAKSELDLRRTKVTAPFAGRVKSVTADTGQLVQPGQRLAVLFDGSAVEVRLPMPLAETAFVDLPFASGATGGGVTLEAEFGGRRHTWLGTVVRVEGEIDRRSRQLTVVARIDDHAATTDGRPPLLIGMFVEAVLHGRKANGALVVPRSALRQGGRVWTIDADNRLRARPVAVLRAEADRVLLQGGVKAGERVCLSELDGMADGMKVQIAEPTVGTEAGGNQTPAKGN